MEIRVTASSQPAAAGLTDYVRLLLAHALAHRRDDVEWVDVRLGDARSRKAPRDAYCLIQLKLGGATSATVLDIAKDPYRAVARAVERAGRVADQQFLASNATPAAACSIPLERPVMHPSLHATCTYPRNSPHAAGRLVALALIADGEIKASEWSVLYEIQARERLGLRGEDWHDLVNALSTDLLRSAAGGSHCRIDAPTLAHWFAEVDDPRLQSLVAQFAAEVVGADGYVDDGEATVLRGALQHWLLPVDEQARLEQMVYGLDFQVVPRDRVAGP